MSDIVTIIARSFSLSELTKIIGEDFASSLPEDTRMTNRTLAEMYINQMGKEIFSEKKIISLIDREFANLLNYMIDSKDRVNYFLLPRRLKIQKGAIIAKLHAELDILKKNPRDIIKKIKLKN